MKRRLTSILLTFVLLAGLTAPALAADTASVIRLTKTSGTVSVSKSSGKSLSLMSNMRLYNGYHVNTSSASYAWLNLDDTKVLKEDARSDVAVQQNGKKLEVKVWAGNVFFDVSQKLGDDESLNISTSTMIVGIRGTSGYVQVMDRWTTQLTILEGTAVCSVSDPVTGQVKTEAVRSGETVECVVYPQEQTGDKCDILRETTATEDVPGFVLTDLVQDVPLCDEILDASGLDILRDLAAEAGGDPSGRSPDGKTATLEVLGETEKRETGDRSGLQEKLDKLEEERKELEDNVSGNKALPTTPPSGGGSSGGGSSGGGSTPATFPVTFDANGGLFEGDVGQTIVQTDESGVIDAGRWPADPTFGTFTFDGWYTAASGGDKVNVDKAFGADTTLYAHWSGWNFDSDTNTLTIASDVSYTGTTPPWDEHDSAIETVDIKPGVTSIGSSAFEGCIALTDITIPGSVTTIGSAAFRGCSALTNVNVPEGVTSIGLGTFAYCASLTGVTIPDTVTSIGDVAFTGCSALTSVTIPSGVTSIGGSAFSSCSALTSVTIPGDSQLTSIGDMAFYSCSALTEIAIPNTVTGIGRNAFWGCSKLTSINIPSGVTSIKDGAFWGCSALTGVTIPEDSQLTSIGEHAFHSCSALTEINIPSGVTSIGEYAFNSCYALDEINIPSGVTSIGGNAFRFCSALAEINIPSGVTSIGEYAFHGCSRLKDIYFNDTRAQWDDNVTKGTDAIPSGATVHCTDDIHTITFDANGGTFSATDSSADRPTTTADTGADGKVASWPATPSRGTNFTLSGWYDADGNKVDKDTVFSKNTTVYARWNGWEFDAGTNTLTIAGDGPMDDYSSSSLPPWDNHKSSINTVKIENGVTSIGSYAFYNYSSVTNVTLPDGLESIGNRSFTACSMTAVTIPEGVASIGSHAFFDCGSLTSVTIPSSVTSIADTAFSMTGLTSVVIPSRVTRIEDYTFSNCTSLTSVTIPEGVTSIGSQAFYNCASLASVTIPGNVTTIGGNAFSKTALTSVTFQGTREQWNSAVGTSGTGSVVPSGAIVHCMDGDITGGSGWSYDESAKTLTITGIVTFTGATPPWNEYDSTLKTVNIQSGVTRIESYAFQDCTALTEITIPDGVTYIGWQAFENCTSLASVTIPASVGTIDADALKGCSALKDIYFGGTQAAWDKLGVSLPTDESGKAPTVHCSGSGTGWSYDAITRVLDISSMTDYSNLAESPWNAYRDELTTVIIRSGVTAIGTHAFTLCSELTSVTIPASVTAINGAGFMQCDKLTTINYEGTKAQWNSITKNDYASLGADVTIHCTDGDTIGGSGGADTPSGG